jgi:DNA/RNA-binding domain of Phe-tRNA-synthetase-like protein
MREGWIEAQVASEFPALRLHQASLELTRPVGRSPQGVRERLRELSDAFTGAKAVMMRTQPIHHAHRVFFRHIGLDPDKDRPPAEAIAVERLRAGHFKSNNLLDDAIVIAVMETGVPLWALDDSALDGELGIRGARPGEAVGGVEAGEGRLVVADASAPVAVLFGDVGPGVTKATTTIRLFSVQVAGVPSIHVEEAMWTVQECFEEGE